MQTVIVNVNGRAYTAEIIRQDGEVIDVRSLGGGFTTAHNVLPEGIARDGETSYRPETIKAVELEAPVAPSWPKGEPSTAADLSD